MHTFAFDERAGIVEHVLLDVSQRIACHGQSRIERMRIGDGPQRRALAGIMASPDKLDSPVAIAFFETRKTGS